MCYNMENEKNSTKERLNDNQSIGQENILNLRFQNVSSCTESGAAHMSRSIQTAFVHHTIALHSPTESVCMLFCVGLSMYGYVYGCVVESKEYLRKYLRRVVSLSEVVNKPFWELIILGQSLLPWKRYC